MKRVLNPEKILALRLADPRRPKQQVVAKEIGMDRMTLRRWEREALERFDYNHITALARYYGVPVDTLLQNPPEQTPTEGEASTPDGTS